MFVYLVSQKGGVGKSTVARLFAVEMARAGWAVKIADLDPKQGTASKWRDRRDAAGITPAVAVQKFRDPARAIKDAGDFHLLILDGPAHAERAGLSLAAKADLVLMPTCFSLDDLEAQVEAAFELEADGVAPEKIRFVFARGQGSEAEEKAARAYLDRAGLVALPGVLRELPSIRQAHASGRAASETKHRSVNESATGIALAIAEQLNLVQTKGGQ